MILTGTPSGVGAAHVPPRWLQDGDVVEITIEGIGTLRNPVTCALGIGWTRDRPLERSHPNCGGRRSSPRSKAGTTPATPRPTRCAGWRARRRAPIATLDPEEYLDFQAARPTVELIDGVLRTVNWPALTFSAARTPPSGRDLVLLLGIEPNLKWRAFCDDVVAVARTTGCEIVVTLGALLGDTPHSRPIRCTGSATDEVLAARLGHASGRATKARPASSACCTTRCAALDFPSASIWAPVPHYVASPPNPKATRAILDKLAGLLDLRPRPHRPRHRVGRVGTLRRRRRRVRLRRQPATSPGSKPRYDESLDRRRSTDDEDEEDEDDDDWLDEDDLPSGDSLAEDFERYLREHRED